MLHKLQPSVLAHTINHLTWYASAGTTVQRGIAAPHSIRLGCKGSSNLLVPMAVAWLCWGVTSGPLRVYKGHFRVMFDPTSAVFSCTAGLGDFCGPKHHVWCLTSVHSAGLVEQAFIMAKTWTNLDLTFPSLPHISAFASHSV